MIAPVQGGLLAAAFACVPCLGASLWGDQGDGTFRNPVIWADYNNPAVIKTVSGFYLTSATHHFMGMPLLHSRDLVNWTPVGSLYGNLRALSPDFDFPGKQYGAGSQDGEIGFHQGTYYMYNWSTRHGGFFVKAKDIRGPWSEPLRILPRISGMEDPCPFWDDDGKPYLLLVGNPGPLKIYRLNDAGDRILDDGAVLISNIAPKGPQIFKKDGWYYIGVANTTIKQQWFYRSRALYGPYERRQVLENGNSGINAAQGSLVETDQGQTWFVHHDYNLYDEYGRRIFLQPAGWRDGWPWIGVDRNGNGIGEPVGLDAPYPKPSGPAQPIRVPDPSDGFEGPALAPQWMWNHNPRDTHWSLSARPGWMRLTAQRLNTSGGTAQLGGDQVAFREDGLLFAHNTLTQRILGKVVTISAGLDTRGMIDGQRAGLAAFMKKYAWIGVVREGGTRTVKWYQGDNGGNTTVTQGPVLSGDSVWLRLAYNDARGSFSYSLDGLRFTPLGPAQVAFASAWYEGTKVGLFTYNLSTGQPGGTADFDFIRQDHDGPKGGPVHIAAPTRFPASQPHRRAGPWDGLGRRITEKVGMQRQIMQRKGGSHEAFD